MMIVAARTESWGPAVETVGLHFAEGRCFWVLGAEQLSASRGQLERPSWSEKGVGEVTGPEQAVTRGRGAEPGP